MPSRPVRALFRLLLFIFLNLILFPPFALTILLRARRIGRRIQLLWCGASQRIIGLDVRVHGHAAHPGPVLYVANHVSYLDIPVLCGLIDATFVAKADVASWPFFGLLARLTRTVFVHRQGSQARSQQRELQARLAAGESLILFPEGTSTDGAGVWPFKSSLFSIVEGNGSNVRVQPVSIAYTKTSEGTPLDGARRHFYAWFGSEDLVPHMRRMLGLPGATVQVQFHPVIEAGTAPTRKALAKQAEAAVAEGVYEAQAAAGAGDLKPPLKLNDSQPLAADEERRWG